MNKESLCSFLLGAIAIILLWYVIATLVQIPIIPSPIKVFQKLADIFFDSIFIHAIYSLFRIGAGLVAGIIVGYPLGVLMGYYPVFDKMLSPIVYLTYPVPKIAMLPILMLIMGVGEGAKIVMIFLIIVFQVVISVRDSIKSIPKETYYPLYSLGASHINIFFEVLLPASLPKFLTAFRVAMATAISVLFFTETYGTQYGMGFFIMDAWLRVNYLEMYAGIVVLSFIGMILFATIDLLERKFCRWQLNDY